MDRLDIQVWSTTAFAFAEGRVLFTHDADFLRLATAGAHHAGIVYAHQRTSVGEIIRGLMLIYQTLDAEVKAQSP